MKQLFIKFKQISLLILAIAFIGCEEDDAVLPTVTAGFTYTLSDAGVATFINVSENANKYTWNFGDQNNTTSSLINPVFAYGIGSYTVKLTATNVAGASDTFESTIMVLDTEAPLIALVGDATINVTLGDTFTDPGATALDEVDGDITANIVVGGDTVDTSTEGTYVITYNVSDSQGNAADEVERTVIVSAIACEAETEESYDTADLNITFLTDPEVAGGGVSIFEDNVTYEYVNNPDVDNDVNKSCKVGKITKSGVQPWDNLQINFDDKFTFTDGSSITMKIYSPVAGYNVTLKLEDKGSAGAINSGDVLSTTQTTKTNEWEELTIPFNASASGIYDKMVIFFDLQGVANTNAYYIDDIKLNLGGGGGGGGGCTAETMQSLSPSDLNLTFMNDPGTTATQGSESNKFFQDNVTYEYVDNPDFNGSVNTSCKVGKVTKSGVQPWDNLQIDFDEKFTFSDGDSFSIKVFSPVSGYKVALKLEDKTSSGATNSGDRFSAVTTKTNDWEELTIPFGTADSGIYDRLVIFFDLEGPANTNVYYFDDLKLNSGGSGGGGGGGGACPEPPSGELLANGGFEANNGDGACWQFNLNGGIAAVSTEQANTGTYSAKLTTGANQAPNIKWERFASTIAPGTTVEVTFKYRFTTALGTGSILQVLAFSEKTEGAVEHNLGNATDQPLNTWNTFTGTFETAGDIAEGISLLLQLTGSGNADGGGVVYIDDVVVKQL
ncbi:protein of unknown function [Hyunsoonleella jejuensis]|uniref:PKD domain-containing protein n=1 Tax=Hyunsoonleella jejuensis TaxID=419940 RepID=A0A1H9B4X7_9FLAO|nr:immunoglobulin-like domain-containing protein [Hyunsoonleella jejuensis]SEP83994.1 protein of unknown function [Hyunsoonleella jejuensis]